VNVSDVTFCRKCGFALATEKAIEAEENIKTEMDKTFALLLEVSKNPALLAEFEKYRHAQKI
jgi:hypothetical protein